MRERDRPPSPISSTMSSHNGARRNRILADTSGQDGRASSSRPYSCRSRSRTALGGRFSTAAAAAAEGTVLRVCMKLVYMGLLPSLVSAQTSSTTGDSEPMKILTPLYAHPTSDFWAHMVEAGANHSVSYSVVINPNSGPGTETDPDYTLGIYDLWNAEIEVLCYVATGFGERDVETVKQDVDMYEQLYPGLCGGFFFDEGASTEENAYKYTEYYTHAQAVKDYAIVVVNPGIPPDESLYHIGDAFTASTGTPGGQVVIVSFEHKFSEFNEKHEVPAAPTYAQDRYLNAILVYAAYFATLEEFLAETVLELYCWNWGYVFFTDDSLGTDNNPWDQTPSYFLSLLEAVANASAAASPELCGTRSPTPSPTAVSVLGPGETRAPVRTPGPTEYTTPQPAAIGQTIAPIVPEPTPAPTLAPSPRPTMSPTAPPTPIPTPSPTPLATAVATPRPTPNGSVGETDQPVENVRVSSSGRAGATLSPVSLALSAATLLFVARILPG